MQSHYNVWGFVEPYRFEVTVNDLLLIQHLQALEQGAGETTDQGQTEALEVVLLDQLIQVDSIRTQKDKNLENWSNDNMSVTIPSLSLGFLFPTTA
jgi:hypothetical protein